MSEDSQVLSVLSTNHINLISNYPSIPYLYHASRIRCYDPMICTRGEYVTQTTNDQRVWEKKYATSPSPSQVDGNAAHAHDPWPIMLTANVLLSAYEGHWGKEADAPFPTCDDSNDTRVKINFLRWKYQLTSFVKEISISSRQQLKLIVFVEKISASNHSSISCDAHNLWRLRFLIFCDALVIFSIDLRV